MRKSKMDVELTADSWGYTYDLERVGEYDIPKLDPVRIDFSKYKWIGFNYATGVKADHKHVGEMGVHFFVNDYVFKSVWSSLGRYTEMMRKFGCMTTPEFSAYLDYPKALQIYNYYRSMAVGAFWQRAGLIVIPTIYTALFPDCYKWCFDGVPEYSSVAVSTNGLGKSKGERVLFVRSFKEMINRLHPYNILWYGEYYPECGHKDITFHIPSFAAERWRGHRSDNTIIEGVKR